MIAYETADLTITLLDCLDDISELVMRGLREDNTAQQQALRVQAGLLIVQMREQMDDLDYEYSLLLCEIGPDMAETYKHTYLNSVKEQIEAQVNG